MTASRPLGRLERLYLERVERDHESLPAKGFFFDDDAAEHVCWFFEYLLRHHKGEWAGKPFELADWQRGLLRELFGWKRGDGTRRYRTAYVEIGRKNGKSEIAAGVGLYLLVGDQEHGAEVYSSATKRDQAKIVFEAAKAMVKQSPELRKHIKALRGNLSCLALSSKFEPLGADGDTLDGLNAHGNLVDELHAHKTRQVLDVLTTSMGSRRQPLTFIITTAGQYDPTSIGWEMHEYAREVLDGIIQDDTFFAFVAAADDEDAWDSDAAVWKANPNLGISVKREYIERQIRTARNQPSFLSSYERYHLDRWTQQVDRWLSMDDWHACVPNRNGGGFTDAARTQLLDPVRLRGRECFGALDLSSKLDLTSLVLAFPDDGGYWDLVCRFWVPAETIAIRSSRDRVPYDVWAREGWITPTEGNVIDYEFIEAEVRKLADRYVLRELAYDPWSAMQTALHLQSDGLDVVEMRQGYGSMSEPTKEFEKLVVSGKLRHGGHPVLTWMANNVAIATDPAGNIKPEKRKSTEKIDGIVAGIMAVGRGIVHQHAGSVYETRDLVVVG